MPKDRSQGRSAKTKLAEVVLVCRKCAKRQGLRARSVAARLKAAGKAAPGRWAKLRIVETGCLGPCPKRLLAVATGASVATGRVLLIEPEASTEAIARAILPEFSPNDRLAEPPPADGTPG